MKKLCTLLFLFPGIMTFASQKDEPAANPYTSFFDQAYQTYPDIPRGVLEAVAFTNTRFHHVTHTANENKSCAGLPEAYGVMGLTLDGKNYFNDNLKYIAHLSGYSIEDIITSPEKNILAFAGAYHVLRLEAEDNAPQFPNAKSIAGILSLLSELPRETPGQQFALQVQLYEYLSFLNDAHSSALYKFQKYNFDLKSFFGEENYKILSSASVTVTGNEIHDGHNDQFKYNNNLPNVQSPDYGPAIWNPAASCNYTTGRTMPISAVTIHDTEGSYAGAISWFQNCNAQVSAHYVIRSSDGQITQMVLESNKAWHVGTENGYTIGIEHEGYQSQQGWYTTAMYTASAGLVADICSSGYGINPIRTGFWPWLPSTYYNQSSIPGSCCKIKGHQHYPNQTHTDPGPNWDWDYYYKLINPMPAPTVYTAASGTFYDSGGPSGNYSDDERTVWRIAPTGATSVTLNFSSFNVENTWDYLYIYDGNDVWAPLIGYYTGTTSPGTVTSSGGAITVEFRSDCATNSTGWACNWTSTNNIVTPTNLSVAASSCPQIGVTLSWTNSGSGWYADISDDPNFSYFWNKSVANITSTACPGSFCLYPNCNSYLKFKPNTTYYWRIWNGSTETYGAPFTTPNCTSTLTTCSGNFYDSGGPSNPYAGNEYQATVIAPINAQSVTVNFSSFDLENGFDSLYAYDGNSVNAPLIGGYTGITIPASITSTGSALTFVFISDPFVNNAGWNASWTCNPLTTGINALNNNFALNIYPNPFSGTATVSYKLEESARVEMKLTDVLGRELSLYKSSSEAAGEHRFELSSGGLSRGIYLLNLSVNDRHTTVRVMVN